MRRIIADSGSTKTDWCWTDNNTVVGSLQTQGINPVHMERATILQLLTEHIRPTVQSPDTEVFFYGAGCAGEYVTVMRDLLAEGLGVKASQVFVYSDMLGAARAVCGHEAGIACILGTGSNSCYYDGRDILANIPPLGYILGDEGSGAALGKAFLNAIFKGALPATLRDRFLETSGQSYADIIHRVYRQPQANRYLASLTRFMGEAKEEHGELKTLIINEFRLFIKRNISHYPSQQNTIGVVGSIGYFFRDELATAAALEGYRVGRVVQRPMEGLLAFHATPQHTVVTLPPLKAALFDLDGVVFDTEPQYTVFWGSEARRYHPEIPDLEHRIKGQTLTQIFDGYFADVKDEQPHIVERLDAYERQMDYRYIAGFEAFIASLRARQVKTAIVTSSNQEKMANVYRQHPELKDWFDEILTSEDFAASKPSPDCYLKAAARLSVAPADCVVFEDSFNGLKSGRAAGAYVVGLSTTNPATAIAPFADQVVNDFTQLDHLT